MTSDHGQPAQTFVHRHRYQQGCLPHRRLRCRRQGHPAQEVQTLGAGSRARQAGAEHHRAGSLPQRPLRESHASPATGASALRRSLFATREPRYKMAFLMMTRLYSLTLLFLVASSGIAAGLLGARYYYHARDHAREQWSRNERIAMIARYRPAKIVMLGDSLTESGEWGSLTGCAIANFGVSGDETSDILARLDGVIATKPKLVFLLAGTNDVIGGRPTAEIAANVSEIVKRLQGNGVQVIVTSLPPILTRREARARLNAAINPMLETGVTEADLVPDGTHLRASGYARWNAALRPYIASLCEDEVGAQVPTTSR